MCTTSNHLSLGARAGSEYFSIFRTESQELFGRSVTVLVRISSAASVNSDLYIHFIVSLLLLQESTWDFHRQKQERENAEARLKQLKSVATTVNKELKPPESGIVGKGATADAGRECRSSGGEENECPAGASGKALAVTKQQNTALGGRKRSAATMGGMAQHELAQSPARIMLGANGARAEVGVTTPRILSHMSGNSSNRRGAPWISFAI